MKASESSLQSFYLRWAGLVSAVLGSLSISAFIAGWFLGVAGQGLGLAISGLAGVLAGYAIGSDILTRVKNREENASSISIRQQQLAWIGIRFSFVLSVFLVWLVFILFMAWLGYEYFIPPWHSIL